MRRNKGIRHLTIYSSIGDRNYHLLRKTTIGICIFSIAISVFPSYYFRTNASNLYQGRKLIVSEEKKGSIAKSLEKELGISIDQDIEDYLLLDAVRKNRRLNHREKEIFYDYVDYIKDNPYINYEEVYSRLLNLDASFAIRNLFPQFTDSTLAVYDAETNDIVWFDWRPDDATIIHEEGHVLEGATSTPRWLSEGMTQLIESEYMLDNPFTLSPVYPYEETLVKFICEIVGSDIVLQSYTQDNLKLLYDALAHLGGTTEEVEKMLTTLDHWITIYANDQEKDEETIDEVVEAFKLLTQYVLDYDGDDEKALIYHYAVLSTLVSNEFGDFYDTTQYTLKKAYLSSKLKNAGYDFSTIEDASGYTKELKKKN